MSFWNVNQLRCRGELCYTYYKLQHIKMCCCLIWIIILKRNAVSCLVWSQRKTVLLWETKLGIRLLPRACFEPNRWCICTVSWHCTVNPTLTSPLPAEQTSSYALKSPFLIRLDQRWHLAQHGSHGILGMSPTANALRRRGGTHRINQTLTSPGEIRCVLCVFQFAQKHAKPGWAFKAWRGGTCGPRLEREIWCQALLTTGSKSDEMIVCDMGWNVYARLIYVAFVLYPWYCTWRLDSTKRDGLLQSMQTQLTTCWSMSDG